MVREQPDTPAVIARVLALAQEKLPANQLALAESFLRQYYRGTAADDLVGSDVLNLYGAALAHWNLARQRRPGTARVHVYNPQLARHGWQSTHTIIEIVHDDMPFLVDSVRMALNARGLTNHLIIHPVMRLRRDPHGVIQAVLQPDAEGERLAEAIMHFEVDRQTEGHALERIRDDIERVLADVRVAVQDWPAMRAKLREVLGHLAANPPPLAADDLAEGQAFLEWIDNDHFTLLGYREYQLSVEGGEDVLRAVADSGLGLLRNPGSSAVSRSFAALPPEVRALARQPGLLVVTKGNARSTVHRAGYLDYVGIKRFGAGGQVAGEWRFLGLYTSAAYNRVPRAIPLLRQKVARIVAEAGYSSASHAGKALINILDNFPRDELFQLPEDAIRETAMGILHLQERQRVRLFVQRDPYRRFFSCIVYVPRERFATEIRQRIVAILEESLQGIPGATEFVVQISESPLARLYAVVRIAPDAAPVYDVARIEALVVEVTRVWRDDFYTALLERWGEEAGTRLFRRYRDAFRAGYRDTYLARVAVSDVEKIEALASSEAGLTMTLYRPLEAPDNLLRFKLFRAGQPIPLSEALPMLENMGLTVLDDTPSKVKPSDSERIWIYDFGIEHQEQDLDLDEVQGIFQDAFAQIWCGDVENDGFNRLVLGARLSWRAVVVLRAYCKYLLQAKITFSQTYMTQALVSNPHVAGLLFALFEARFDPKRETGREAAAARLMADVERALDAVASLDEDRILRAFYGALGATLRTNFYQTDAAGQPQPYLALKFDPALVPDLPQPRPMFEIFVYSPRMEGVHLRGGKVARGGLRWSDRLEDFRTEVLGLVKAQMVKNAVIVPVGSKGGFVAKALSAAAERDATVTEVTHCYQTFVRGLLAVTDNLVGGAVVPPAGVVRHDGDDPYLVVAADKGTATFSDIANGIADEYGFWLSDAFASGGSAGYDHKKMGITARGAWESVKRHFRELGTDCQSSDVTVVGIGDMAGDVFGNGMLLSRHIKLVAAFNHQHIFIDPNPDAAASYQERQRLFQLTGSSWADYDRARISPGGGIYPRAAKSIALSAEARAALGVEAERFTPSQLIQALLRAPVDLLWNGGIGTYVKASDELHAEVGDRANDALRVNASELRCRVVGEGGNLGFTQRSRIEFALNGGRINTDAIDNSGGVDCSDHEVNIKILLNNIVASGDMTRKQRDALLVEMTDEVANLVLGNNYLQTQAISLAEAQAPAMVDVHFRLMRALECKGALDRRLENLPAEGQLVDRKAAGRGLARPKLAVLLAYSKLDVYQQLVASDLPNDAYLRRELELYFPTALRKRFRDRMAQHRLSQEIICTQVANNMVNRGGISFAFRLQEETGAAIADIARAYVAAGSIFDAESLWGAISLLDNQVAATVQLDMLLRGRRLMERGTRWLLRRRARPLAIEATLSEFVSGVQTVAQGLCGWLAEGELERLQAMAAELCAAGVPQALAERVAGLGELLAALDIVDVAASSERTIAEVATVYFRLAALLELHWLREHIVALPHETRWQTLARAALREDLYSQHSALAAEVLGCEPGAEAARLPEVWRERNQDALVRFWQVLADLKSAGTPDFSMLSVVLGEMRGLRTFEPAVAARPAAKRSARR